MVIIKILKIVDYYSIEASFISLALIDQIHRSGKQIYAWTVNKASTMIHDFNASRWDCH